MRRSRTWALALLALCTLPAARSGGGPILQSSVLGPPILVVTYGATEMQIPEKLIGPNRPAVVAPASFGTLENRPEGLFFVPDAGFWDRGVDTFALATHRTSPESLAVFVLAEHPALTEITEDFEGPNLPGFPWILRFPGLMALSLDSGFPSQALALPFGQGAQPALGFRAKGGGGTTGTRITFGVDPDPYSDPNLAVDLQFPVSESYDDQGSPLWKVVIRVTNEGGVDQMQVRGEALVEGGAFAVTPWAPLPFGVSRLRFHWWPSSAPGASDGGMYLTHDGVPLAQAIGLDIAPEFVSQVSFGLLGSTEGLSGNLYLDDLTFASEAEPPDLMPLFVDGGETGNLAPWVGLPSAPTVQVAPAAARDGQYGFDFDLTSGNSVYLQDHSPEGRSRLRTGFDVNLKQLNQPVGNSLVLLRLVESGQATAAMKLVLASTLDGYVLRARVRQDDGSWLGLADVPCSGRGWHYVETQWWSATSGVSDDGGLRLWVDGQLVGERLDLDNASYLVESTEIGARGVNGTTSGRIYMDNYASRY